MATEKEINSWYDSFAKRVISEDLGINLYQPKDVERLRVPALEGNSTRPLFENGFRNTIEDKTRLYEYAKNGTLFAFSKKDNAPYQITEKQMQSCDRSAQKEQSQVSGAQKAGYVAVSIVWAPVRFAIGLGGRIFNLLTLGLFDKQVKTLGKGLDKMTGAWSERLFSVKQQEKEREKKVSVWERIGNILTLGSYQKDKIAEAQRESEYEKARDVMGKTLSDERKSWQEQEEQEEKLREEEKNKSQAEKELEVTKEKIKELETEPEKTVETQNLNSEPEAEEKLQISGKEMKSQLQMKYEEMRMAFGPGGDGFVEAAKLARDMNKMIEQLNNDPEALKESGMKPEKLKEFSNMCSNMEKIGKEGLNAKAELMDIDKCKNLTPMQKEQRICQMQLMNMVEKAMVNSAYVSYLKNDGLPGKALSEMKSSKLFNAMHKDPKVFEYEMHKSIRMLDSTEQLKNMPPEEVSEFISKPEQVRKALNTEIQKGSEEVKEQRQQEQVKLQQENQRKQQQIKTQEQQKEIVSK